MVQPGRHFKAHPTGLGAKLGSKESKEEVQMVLDCQALNCSPAFGWDVIFACVSLLLKKKIHFVVMVVLPKGNSDLKFQICMSM